MTTTEERASATYTGLPVKTLSDLSHDAIMLHGFIQGVIELHDLLKIEVGPASNAMPPLFDSLLERADRLSSDLERLDGQ